MYPFIGGQDPSYETLVCECDDIHGCNFASVVRARFPETYGVTAIAIIATLYFTF